MIKDVLKDDTGSKIVAVILGVGLAAILRRTCKGSRCVVVRSPGHEDILNNYYKLGEDCYRYKPYAVDCEEKEEEKQRRGEGRR